MPPNPAEESIEELDWSELLEVGSPVPPPPPSEAPALPVDGDEDFFEESPPGSLDPPPGKERGAWGLEDERLSAPPIPVVDDLEDEAPFKDPLEMPVGHFAAAYRPPVSADHGSVSQEIGPDDSRRRRRSTAELVAAKERRDLALMSDDSIEMMLDEDFRAWEDTGVSGPGGPDDSTDLEALLSRGLDTPVPATGELPATQPYASPEPAAVALPADIGEEAPAAPEHAPVNDLDALLQAGLSDIDAIEAGEGPVEPPRQLIKRPPPGTDLDELMARARQKQQAGDFSGSLALVEDVLAGNPEHAEARQYLTENTSRLLAMYRSKLGNLQRAPRVKLRPQEIIWQSLDHRAGFILSQVDGLTPYEDIVEISGMSELEATRVLARLVEHGVIG